MAKVICPYEVCKLPQNNRHYLWQIGYMLIGLGVLFFKAEDFTFFQTFLFLAPVVLDLLNTSLKIKVLNGVRIVFGILDAALLLSCLLGMFGVFEDTGTGFAVSESFLYFSGVEIKKTIVGIVIALNLAVPILFYIGSPCQQTMKMSSAVKSVRREGARQK